MPAPWDEILTPQLLAAVALGSMVLSVVSLAATLILLVRLPVDYFLRPDQRATVGRRAWWLRVLRNLCGTILLGLGLLMLALPGQGLLTILAAIILMDVPAKRRFEGWLVRRPRIRATIDRLRARFRKPPLQLDD